MIFRRSYFSTWMLVGSLLAATPVLAYQKNKQQELTPAQQAERAKFNPKAEESPFGGTVVEQAVAQVNDQIINTSDYNRAEQQLEQEARQQNWSDQELQAHKSDLLRDLIDQQLLLSRGKDLSITGETELVRRLDDIRKQNHLASMEDLEKAVAAQSLSYEDFKQNIRNGIITQQVIRDEVGRHIQFTDSQLQQYYHQHLNDFTQPESVRLSEILIPVKTGGDENAKLTEAKAKADDVYGQLKSGADFATLAKQDSIGSTAGQGGDLGEFKRGALAKELEDDTFALQAGQFTQPIRTRQGFVILKVIQHIPGGEQPLSAVRPQVEEAAFMSQMQPKLREYLAHLRENAYIDIRPGYQDSATVHSTSMPLYSAYTPPGKKKKVHFKRRRYAGQHRGRHAAEAAAPETAETKTGATSSGTATALANAPGAEKPGKKEKIRFGQAPREALPPAAHTETNNTEVAANNTASPASSAASSSTEDISGVQQQQPAESKTRFAYRAREHHKKVKPRTADVIENERAGEVAPTQEAADKQVQSAPLGLAGDTANKKAKSHHEKGEKKTRYSDEANKPKQAESPSVGSTPSPLARPESNPVGPNGSSVPGNGSNPDNSSGTPATQPQQ